MNTERELSLRQVLVAVVLAGLSLAAAQGGRIDWKWGAVGVALSVPVVGWVMGRARRAPVYQGGYGVALAGVYALWSTLALGHLLGQTAQRLELTGGSQGVFGWMILLLALPVGWMSAGKPAAFFRGGEIYWMAMVAVLVVVGLLTAPQVTPSYLWTQERAGWTSALAAAGTVATAAWALPYLYQVPPRQKGEGDATGRWLVLLGALILAVTALTRGVLGEAAGALAHPFFVTTGVMGESARTEGLISAVWLICDLMGAGLLTRVWGGGRGPVVCVVLGTVVALTGWTQSWPWLVWPLGNLVLLVLGSIAPRRGENTAVKY